MCKFQLIIKLLLISTYSLKGGGGGGSCKTMLQEVPNSIHSSDYILLYSQDKTRIKAINRCVLLLPYLSSCSISAMGKVSSVSLCFMNDFRILHS